MKETIKVAIGGFTFMLETDAYQLLESYLNSLKNHFKNKEDGLEIINDIESRMSELLQLKAESPAYIITLTDAQDIIQIMGNPIDFDDVQTQLAPEYVEEYKTKDNTKKRIFRDTSNAVLGGVCSGLGQYFRVDPVIIRIAYFVSMMLTAPISDRLSATIFMSYFVLWLAMPAAKTFKQKLSMSGQKTSIEDIETGNIKPKEIRGRKLGRTIKSLLKTVGAIIFSLIGLSITLSALSALFFSSIFDMPSVKDILESNGVYTTNVMVSIWLLWLIPAFAAFLLAIACMTKFSVKNFVMLGLAFILWLATCGYLATTGIKISKNYKHRAITEERFIPNIQSDTIRIRLSDEYRFAEQIANSDLYLINGSTKSWFILPEIEVIQDSSYKQVEMQIQKIAFDSQMEAAEQKAQSAKIQIIESRSGIVIKPHLYNRGNSWDRELFNLTIYCPSNKTICIDKLLEQRAEINSIITVKYLL
ncbi:MAG: hypothetical protein RL662_1632 [Bacteroidota bacterium]|jgi:phage shock protein PspC (stress-responsive transcriptional regulator)/DNA-binding protein